jgi:hypothetical protein
MATHAEPGTIQVTDATARALDSAFDLVRREGVAVKGKGLMTTYELRGRR